MVFACFVGSAAFGAGWFTRGWFSARRGSPEAAGAEPVQLGSALHGRLCEHLHGTSTGPYGCISNKTMKEDHSYPHTNVPSDFLYALFEQLQPQFLVEVGSFKGGSSIRMASALARLHSKTGLEQVKGFVDPKACLVCIDTFLGDAAMWLNKQATGRSSLLLKDGCPQLFLQFMVNTQQYADIIVPFPISSLCGLRALQHLAAEEIVPLVDSKLDNRLLLLGCVDFQRFHHVSPIPTGIDDQLKLLTIDFEI